MLSRIKARTWLSVGLMGLSIFWLSLRVAQHFLSDPVVQANSSAQLWWEVYFSAPYLPSASTGRGGPDEALVEAMDQAQHSIDLAAYDLDLEQIAAALKRAHARGVRVQIVMESDNILEPIVQDLEEAGIPVLGDRREALMHHKFAVIDELQVWTGSMNFTENGAYRNSNNIIALRSQQVAADYHREFEEMFIDDQFGAMSNEDTPNPRVALEGSEVEVYFSPDDGVEEELTILISQASNSIQFMAFSFTSDPISASLLEAAQRGIAVRGIMESSQARGLGSEYGVLREAGLDVRLDQAAGNMHHKVLIIDEQIVVTGSYNFSKSAEERNDENVLVIHNASIARLYLDEFERIFEESS
jgi:phosphatidylserine/phosphatidylglycerophosphate/cardiolipin synthase-like enzyme